jgi:hypothetical protein
MSTTKPRPESLFSDLLHWLYDGYWPRRDDGGEPVAAIRGALDVYTPQRLLAVGDVTEVYLATGEYDSDATPEALYLLKVARVADGGRCLEIERKCLAALLAAAKDSTYQAYLPALVESLPASERLTKPVNVFAYEPGWHTLEQVHEQHPALDGRHLGWIFKRLLTVVGFCHRHDWMHAALLPGHVLIEAAGHGLRLVGWGQSVEKGQQIKNIPKKYKEWYPPEVLHKRPAGPATDLFVAARLMVYLAGGDPVTSWMPETVPLAMRQFFSTCLLESARMRPDDAWAVMEDYDELLHRLYGPPKFIDLTLT